MIEITIKKKTDKRRGTKDAFVGIDGLEDLIWKWRNIAKELKVCEARLRSAAVRANLSLLQWKGSVWLPRKHLPELANRIKRMQSCERIDYWF